MYDMPIAQYRESEIVSINVKYDNSTESLVHDSNGFAWPCLVLKRQFDSKAKRVVYTLNLIGTNTNLDIKNSFINPYSLTRFLSMKELKLNFIASNSHLLITDVRKALKQILFAHNIAEFQMKRILNSWSFLSSTEPSIFGACFGPEVIRIGDFIKINTSSQAYQRIRVHLNTSSFMKAYVMVDRIELNDIGKPCVVGQIYVEAENQKMKLDKFKDDLYKSTIGSCGYLDRIIKPWFKVFPLDPTIE